MYKVILTITSCSVVDLIFIKTFRLLFLKNNTTCLEKRKSEHYKN